MNTGIERITFEDGEWIVELGDGLLVGLEQLAEAIALRDSYLHAFKMEPAVDNPIEELWRDYNYAQMAIVIASLPIDIDELIRKAA